MTNPLTSYGRPYLDDKDIDAVVDVLKGDFLTGGAAIELFEGGIKTITHSDHALCCSNGTAALHMACYAVGLQPGHSVIVPSVTFLATANAAKMMGADVVFADINPNTGLMERSHFEEALGRCPSEPYLVMPVHFAGQVSGLPEIHDLARERGMKIIEDASHAFGSTYDVGEKTYYAGDCTYSDITTFSFHAVKNITTGEGGAVATQHKEYHDLMHRFRSHGMVRDKEKFHQDDMAFLKNGKANPWYYEMPDFGFNYRLTDIQAALGFSQLQKIQEFKAKRTQIKEAYDTQLAGFTGKITPVENVDDCAPFWHVYPVMIDFEALRIARGEVMSALHEKGIASQVHYIPVHMQPYYKEVSGDIDLPGAASYYAKTLTLPLHPQMDAGAVAFTINTLADILGVKS